MVPFSCVVTAPAKINLSLRIVGRRRDGYHQLDSLFAPLAFADTVSIRGAAAPVTSVSLYLPGKPALDGGDNLAARAARELLQHVGVSAAVELEIEKRVWQAAGLGGGSSDAAAVLLTLNAALQQRRLAAPELAQLALRLGADVPFFLDPRPARAQGVGEQLTPVEGVPPLTLVLANPGVPLSTVDVFEALGLTPGVQLAPPPQPERVMPSLEAVAALMINDLEPVATRLCPAVGELRARLLQAGAVAASMSGSGATVFGLFRDQETARRAEENIRSIPGAYAECTTTLTGLTADT